MASASLIVAAEHAGAVVPIRCSPVAPSIGGGGAHALLLGSDGTVRAAGENSFGQLGNNTQTSTATPVIATGLSGLTTVASSPGGDHSVALKSDGTVWTWGINWWGQLGNGEMGYGLAGPSVPGKVSGVSDVVAVAAGDFHTLALTETGTVWAWGRNYVGELGDGTTNDSAVPVQVSGLTGVVAIAAGSDHSLAVKSNGEVWTWGQNSDAQLGLGFADYLPHMVPAKVPGITNATGVAGGRRHSLAITAAGTAYGWGYNDVGAAGPGFTGGPINPTPVFGLTSLVAIAAGAEHSLGLKSDGSVWSWGWALHGQLGNGYYGYSAFTGTPMQVSGIANAKAIAAPGAMSFAVRSDGKIYGWGDNDDGQLGLGSGTDRTSPVQVPTVTQSTPAVPTKVEAVAGEQIALVTWEAPASVVTQYVVTPYRNGVAQPQIGTGLPKVEFPVPSLVAGDTYKFEVAAQNCLGESSPSAQTKPVVPVDVQRDETGFSVEGWSLNDRHGARVNVSNGNLKINADDIAIAGTGLPLVLSRSYNSRGSTTSAFGNNWATSVGTDIRLEILPTGSVYFHGPGGAKVGFAKNGTTFVSPAGVDATLTQDAVTSTYTLTHNFEGGRLEFSATGQLLRGVDRNGSALTYTYVAGRLTKVTDTQNRDLTFTYDASGRVTKVTDVTAREWRYAYDGSGNLITYTDPANGVTRYDYASGRLSRIRTPGDAAGPRIVEFAYDGSGRLSKLTYPQHPGAATACSGGAAVSTTCFDYQPKRTVVTDGNGNTTTYDVDAIGRTTLVTDALGNTTSSSYTSNSNVKRRSVGSATTSYSYTTGNALTGVAFGTGSGFSLEYNDAAHPFLPTKVTDPQGHKTALTYDGPGNVVSRKDDLPADHTVSVTRNVKGQPTSATDARNKVTSYGYDANGNLDKVTPPAPLGDYDVTYDALSRIDTVTDGKNLVTDNDYDAMDRIVKTTFPDGSTVRYEYDGDGNLAKTIDAYGTTVTTYDRRNNLSGRTTPDGNVVTYTYDGVGNLASLTDSAGTVTYSYNAANLLSAVVEPDGDATVVSYDKDYNRAAVRYPNGVAVFSTYDASRRLQKTTAVGGTLQTLLSYEYGYKDTAGNDTSLRQSVKDNAGNVTAYTYDVLNRLTRAKTTAPAGSTLAEYAYAYDGAGNRTSQTVYDGVRTVTTTYTYNSANQLVAVDGLTTLAFDGNGNYTGTNTGDEHVYNAKEQTVSVRRAGAAPLTMRYEGTGQQDRSSIGAPGDVPLVAFTNTTLGVTQERLASGLRRDYVRDDSGQVLSQTTAAGTYYAIFDGLGSTVGLTAADGSLAGTVEYSPYGQATKVTGVAATMPFRFAGTYLDPTGLYKMGERYYDPSLGRFTQQDPVHDPLNPKQWNRYLYVGGDPVNFVDPTGLKSMWRRAWDEIWNGAKCVGSMVYDWLSPDQSLGNLLIDEGVQIIEYAPVMWQIGTTLMEALVMDEAAVAFLAAGGLLWVAGIGLVTYGIYKLWKDNCS